MNAIGWCDETCNPVVGCYGPGGTAEEPARCGCCYAHRMARRVAAMRAAAIGEPVCEECRDFVPHFHPERVEGMTRGSGREQKRVVFVGSMCDLWSEGVLPEWRRAIWQAIGEEMQPWLEPARSNYVMLTKRPWEIDRRELWYALGNKSFWLSNVWVGVSAGTQRECMMRWDELCDEVPAGRRILSLEPLAGWVTLVEPKPDWLIIGPETPVKRHAMRPCWAELQNMLREAREERVPVWMKTACEKAWPGIELVQERPEEMR